MDLKPSKFDLERRYFRVAWHDGDSSPNEQFIDYPRDGVTFLLGKNGAGKSTLINGLRNFAESRLDDRCTVSLICSSSSSDMRGWDEYHRYLLELNEKHDYWGYVRDRVPPMVNEFWTRRSTVTPRGIGGRFRGMSAIQILESLGYQVDNSNGDFVSKGASITEVIPDVYWHSQVTSIPSHPVVPQDPRWVLLDMMAECDFDAIKRLDNQYVRGFSDPGLWLDDKNRMDLLRSALDEFCSDLQIEFSVGRGSAEESRRLFRYLSTVEPGGALEQVLRLLHDEQATFPKEQLGENLWISTIWSLFPHDLFAQVSLPRGRGVAGPWIPWAGPPPFKTSYSSPETGSRESLEGREAEVLSVVTHKEPEWTDGGARLQLAFEGFGVLDSLLASAESALIGLDLGIGGIRYSISPPAIRTSGFAGGWEIQDRLHLEWFDARSGSWRYLLEASDGQQRAMSLVLGGVATSQGAVPLVLGDEFDRTFHPHLARQLAEQFDRELKSAGGIGILSTHNVALSTSTDNAPWEMTRHIDGSFRFVEFLDPLMRAEALGVPESEILRMSRLVILVEGFHDEVVLKHLFSGNTEVSRDVRIINANGIKNVRNLWDGHLRLLDCPILVVHDKKISELEDSIMRARSMVGEGSQWKDSGLAELRERVRMRGNDPARTELKNLLDLLETVINQGALARIRVHGIDADDIVDCLPFDRPFRTRGRTSWTDAHEKFRADGRVNGNEFKQLHNITNDTLREALENAETIDPRLAELYDLILRILRGFGTDPPG
jgi:hypothetical protein